MSRVVQKKIPTFKIKKAKAEWLYFFAHFLEGKPLL
jgi:hypothetical protein